MVSAAKPSDSLCRVKKLRDRLYFVPMKYDVVERFDHAPRAGATVPDMPAPVYGGTVPIHQNAFDPE
jgi:hypothetical protein